MAALWFFNSPDFVPDELHLECFSGRSQTVVDVRTSRCLSPLRSQRASKQDVKSQKFPGQWRFKAIFHACGNIELPLKFCSSNQSAGSCRGGGTRITLQRLKCALSILTLLSDAAKLLIVKQRKKRRTSAQTKGRPGRCLFCQKNK